MPIMVLLESGLKNLKMNTYRRRKNEEENILNT